MKKCMRLISVLLTLVMALGIFPAALITANALDYYDLYVGKWRADSVTKNDIMHDGGSAKYDPVTHTLTLDNPTITSGTGGCTIMAKGDLKIVGTISYTKSGDYGVKVTGGSLTLGDSSGDPSSFAFIGKTAAVYAEGDIKIENCALTVTSESGSGIESKTGSVKINCKDKDVIAVGSVYGIKAETEVNVLGGKVRAVASADDSIGMYAKTGEVYIEGEVSATGEKAGIWALSSFAAVNDAVVTAVCTREREKNTTDYGYGIYCGDNFGANGTLDVRGGHTAIYAKKNCTITGGSVSADKAWYGFGIAGDYSQDNADVRGRGQINGFGVAGKCDINSGTLFAEGPSDAAFHVNGAVTIDSALVINLPEGGTLDGSKIKNAEGYEAKTVQIGKPIEKYKVWVGSLQLTELNKNDPYGDGTVVYDASTHTLILNEPTVLGSYKDSKIYIDGIDVVIRGKATLEGADFGINSDGGSIDLFGDFTLKGKHSGISCGGNLAIEEGKVVAEGEDYEGIYTSYDCVIDGDDVTATGGTCGIYSEDGKVYIGGGIVTATGAEERAVYVNNGTFEIDHGATLNADGNEHGIFALKGIALKDSHVDAKSKTAAAIRSGDESVIVESCTLNAESEQGAAVDCADGDFVFNGTAVLKGKTDGVKARRVTVNDGRLEAYGADGAAINVGDSGMTMAAGEVIAEGANGILIADSDFYLGGGELSATATSEDAESYALCAANGKLSAINGTVKAKSNGSAVFANGKISLDMTNLSAEAQKGYALGSNSDAVFRDGTSALTSTENDAIHIKGNLLFDNAAKVTAKGGKYGICAEKELYFNKANIDAEGATDAVMSEEGNLSIESSLYLTEPMHGKIDSEKKTVVTLYEEKAPIVKIRTDNISFNVFVGSTEITMDNMDDVQGDAKISFDPVDNTLHFIDNVAITGDHNGAKIYAKDVDLKIDGNEDILDDTVAYGVLVEGG
ncbi:MAG: hypothetical protein IJL26_02610, partial [Clostridia bacterium]|nr:hypothetical protein [Clostridia bacterium]